MACKFTTAVSTLIIGANLAGSGSIMATLPTGGAPTLSSLSADQTGQTTATMGFTASEDCDRWVRYLTAGSAAPSIATMKTGTSAALTANTPATHNQTGLSAATDYDAYVYAENAGGNSGVVHAGTFTTIGTGTASLDITMLRGIDQVAPEAIWFEATNLVGFGVPGPVAPVIYDRRYHEIHYYWTVNDTGSYSSPQQVIASMNDKSKHYGAKISHTFESDGTYTMTCTAFNRAGVFGTKSVNVTVKNAAIEFSGNRTIVVAQAGGFSGAPAGAQQVTSLSAATTALAALGQTGRILLKRGETYTITSQIRIRGEYDNFRIGAWGAGAKPVLHNTVGGLKTIHQDQPMAGGATADLNLHNIFFKGDWDSTTETGAAGSWGVVPWAAAHVSISNCEFDGMDMGVYVHSGTTRLFMHDTVVTNWGDYGVFGDQAHSTIGGFTGVRFMQHVDALNGSTGKATAANHHGPFRHSFLKCYVGVADIFSRNGWSTNPGVTKTDQPCVRDHSRLTVNSYSFYERMFLEGGWVMFERHDSTGVETDVSSNCILDMCYFMGTANTDFMFLIGFGGLTVRNTICNKPDLPKIQNGLDYFIRFDNDQIDATNNASPIEWYGNGFISMLSGANASGRVFNIFDPATSGNFSSEVEVNNIKHAPGLSPSITADGPLSTATAFTPRYKEYQLKGQSPIAGTATPANAAMLFQPLAGSAAIGSAVTPRIGHVDFYGNTRTSPHDRGAIEA